MTFYRQKMISFNPCVRDIMDGRKKASCIEVKYTEVEKGGGWHSCEKFYFKKDISWLAAYSQTPLKIEVR